MTKLRSALAWAREHKVIVTAVAAALVAGASKVWPAFPADEVLRLLASLLAA